MYKDRPVLAGFGNFYNDVPEKLAATTSFG
jgi:hypothetical protein